MSSSDSSFAASSPVVGKGKKARGKALDPLPSLNNKKYQRPAGTTQTKKAPVKKATAGASSKPKKITKKAIKECTKKVTSAESWEVESFLTKLLEQHPECLSTFEEEFAPAKLEQPKADDPLLTSCFKCGAKGENDGLHLFNTKKDQLLFCMSCEKEYFSKDGDTMTRQHACEFYGFKPKEAKEKVPFTTGTNGYYGSTIYLYKRKSCCNFVRKKYGSLYLWAKAQGYGPDEFADLPFLWKF